MNAAMNLPQEWQRIALKELHAGGIGSLDPRNFPKEQFEYYSIPAYQEARAPLLTLGEEIQSQKLLLPPSCLLFGKLNPRVEKVWNVQSTSSCRRLGSTEWLPIVPVAELDQEYGYYLLRSHWVMPIAQGFVSGSTPSRERVEPKAFYDIKVPLPPLDEQRQIASLLALVDRAVLKQAALVAELARLKCVAMRDLFARGLRGEPLKDTELGPLPVGWRVVPLGSLGKIGSGTTPDRTDPAYWAGGTVPWITSGRMYDREIVSSSEHVTPTAVADARLPLLRPGAVLVAIVGQGKTLGHCAILRVEATISRHVGYVQPDTTLIFPEFLRAFLETRYEYLRQLASGNGSTRAALTAAILRAIPVPVPPTLDEQSEVAGIVEAIDRKSDLHKRKATILDELFKALLHKLMTGQIRATDLDMSAIADGSLAEMAS